MDITVKKWMQEADYIIVSKEEDGKHNNNKYFRYRSKIRQIKEINEQQQI